MKKLLIVISLFVSAGAFAQQSDSVKNKNSVNDIVSYRKSKALVVVDGVKIKGGIDVINPNDIERVDVLKSPSATAIYGEAGKNGVILVTTRQGLAERLRRAGTAADTTTRNPLYVIDGNVSDDAYFKKLNPDDIDNITVLKDASASAIYGTAGKNGVIIVVTKAYRKQQQLKKAQVERQGKRD
jgi:TonB-dependent SusC/RagA subfamily outer membrane receptor